MFGICSQFAQNLSPLAVCPIDKSLQDVIAVKPQAHSLTNQTSKYHDIRFVFPNAPFPLERDALPSFDGVVGFSQGAAAAMTVTSLLEAGRKDVFDRAGTAGGMFYPAAFVSEGAIIQPPLKFVVAISGFGGTRVPEYQAFYHPKITTPALHILGRADGFIKPAMSQEVIDACADSQVLYHSGGHSVPKIDELESMNGLTKFLVQVLSL